MTDKELLEYAAKSVGIDGFYDPLADSFRGDRRNDHGSLWWSPLECNEIAFELLATHEFDIEITPSNIVADCHTVSVDRTGDTAADLRRVITMAAAAIGEAME